MLDSLWCEGELALLFGPAACGKSVFAVQLADALARGAGLSGFGHPRGRRRVLYVDLQHTDEQFQQRCVGEKARHRFAVNLFRDRPRAVSQLCEWLRAYVRANKIQAVIIDDLSAVRNTVDGTRETLRVMRQLRELRDELGISILVITDAPPARGVISERELGRSRVLCSAADSVFALDRGLHSGDDYYMLQTRSRRGAVEWTEKYAPTAQLVRGETGLLAFEFDERFSKETDPKMLKLIHEVKRLADTEKKSFRQIAVILGISKSWAYKLRKRWTPAMGEPPVLPTPAIACQPEPPASADGDLSEPPASAGENGADQSALPTQNAEAEDPPPTMIHDLEPDFDANGNEIWVEARQPCDNRPKVWYTQPNKRGDYTRYVRSGYGNDLCNIGPSGLVPHDLPTNISDQMYKPKLAEWQSRSQGTR